MRAFFALLFIAAAVRAVPVDWPRTCAPASAAQTVVDARSGAELAALWRKYDSEPRFDSNSTTFRNDFALDECGDALCLTATHNVSEAITGYDQKGLYTAITLSLESAFDVLSIAVGSEVHFSYTLRISADAWQRRFGPGGYGFPHYAVMGARLGAPYLGGAALLYAPGVSESRIFLAVFQPIIAALPFSLHGADELRCRYAQLGGGACDTRYANRSALGNFERLHVTVVFAVIEPGYVAVSRASVESDESGVIFAEETFPNATSRSSIDGDAQPYVAIVTYISGFTLENTLVRVQAPPCAPTPAPAFVGTSTESVATTSITKSDSVATSLQEQEPVPERAKLTNDSPASDGALVWLPYAFGAAVTCCALLACVLLRARIGRTRTWYALYYNTPGALRPCVCFACRCSDSWDSGDDDEASVSSVPTYIGSPPATPEPFVPPSQAARESYLNRSNNEYSVLPIYDGHAAGGANVYDAVNDEQMRAAEVQYEQFLVPKGGDTDYTRCTGTLME